MAEYTGVLNLTALPEREWLTTSLGPGATANDVMRNYFSSMTIKASPEEMENKAGQVRTAISNMRTQYEEMSRVALSRTAGYWNGEAAELHRKRYQDMQPDIEKMFQCLEEHATNLLEIAQTYTETQTRVTTMAQSLPKDAIE